jgi:hypothetical protein
MWEFAVFGDPGGLGDVLTRFLVPIGQVPEAVFGDIKYDHGFKRFRLKGMAKVSVEFGLVAWAQNLRKYARVQTLEEPVTAEPMVANTDDKVAA